MSLDLNNIVHRTTGSRNNNIFLNYLNGVIFYLSSELLSLISDSKRGREGLAFVSMDAVSKKFPNVLIFRDMRQSSRNRIEFKCRGKGQHLR